ncbi:MAG: glucose PTS transporter subunit IIA [Lachnospiraceae bacterium]|nr:glucose PTS transporter subunit IIA [Lachnospiraceae bacterium]
MSMDIYSVAHGKYVPLDQVNDSTFSSGLMGTGLGIEPEKGVVYAPADGKISMIFPTGHAVGFTTRNGLEILIHIGINTVELKGEGFQVLKKENDEVKAHEELIRFDIETIKAAGLDPTVIMIFTNGDEYNINLLPGTEVEKEMKIAVVTGQNMDGENKMAKEDHTKYEDGKMCSEILDAVGGSQNIKNVFHCVTRLRIVPVNRDRVDFDKLSQVSGLLKVIESSGQLQCVVGTTVAEVYADFLNIAGIKANGESDSQDDNKDCGEKKPNIITQGLNTLAACVTPGLYAIVAGGMIKGIISLLTAIHLFAADSDIITVLNAVGDAPFYFMPFIIGYAAAKRFKVKEIFGIMIAGILMYSTFLSPGEGITGYDFGLFNIPAYNELPDKWNFYGYSIVICTLKI